MNTHDHLQACENHVVAPLNLNLSDIDHRKVLGYGAKWSMNEKMLDILVNILDSALYGQYYPTNQKHDL